MAVVCFQQNPKEIRILMNVMCAWIPPNHHNFIADLLHSLTRVLVLGKRRKVCLFRCVNLLMFTTTFYSFLNMGAPTHTHTHTHTHKHTHTHTHKHTHTQTNTNTHTHTQLGHLLPHPPHPSPPPIKSVQSQFNLPDTFTASMQYKKC